MYHSDGTARTLIIADNRCPSSSPRPTPAPYSNATAVNCSVTRITQILRLSHIQLTCFQHLANSCVFLRSVCKNWPSYFQQLTDSFCTLLPTFRTSNLLFSTICGLLAQNMGVGVSRPKKTQRPVNGREQAATPEARSPHSKRSAHQCTPAERTSAAR
jgi:hypothetical protein